MQSMKWPTELRAARTTNVSSMPCAAEGDVRAGSSARNLCKNHAPRHEIALRDAENPFIVVAGARGDNHSPARNIRNSISLTLMRSHRIISGLN